MGNVIVSAVHRWKKKTTAMLK